MNQHVISCPCCKQPVAVPTLDIVVNHYKLTPLEARILRSVWRGKGMPVRTQRIFDSMYENHYDGGPSQARMYQAFKVSLHKMRKKLEGSGISVVTIGYGQGYRLTIGVN